MRHTRRILVVGSTQGVYGGIEVFMLALGEFLAQQPGLSCRVVFKLVKGYTYENSLRELIAQSPLGAVVLERGDRRLFRHLHWADVIHLQNFPPDVIYPSLLMGKALVSTQHNWKRSALNLHQLLWNLSKPLLDFITYNSAFVARTWEPAKGRNKRYRVIPTLSRLPDLQPDFETTRHGFCFISRWIGGKGVELLIQAYARAALDPIQHPLRLMGGGPLLEPIREQLRKEPIPGIEILGRVSEEQKFEVIGSSRWMVTPPECFEDMGLTPIEGRLLGVPTIASRIGGIPESAGPCALFFTSGDAEGLAERLRQAAEMDESTYQFHCRGCHDSLKAYLQPLEVYPQLYSRFRDGSVTV
jgi:glycosyltransferase involved in cell wall biosynthesis